MDLTDSPGEGSRGVCPEDSSVKAFEDPVEVCTLGK